MYEYHKAQGLCAFLFALALSVLCAGTSGKAAPVPVVKKTTFSVTEGEWSMTWNHTTWKFTLTSCGACDTVSAHGATWRGHWRWQATSRTLTVVERRVHDDATLGPTHTWMVELDDKGVGKAAYVNGRSDIAFSIVKMPPSDEPRAFTFPKE